MKKSGFKKVQCALIAAALALTVGLCGCTGNRTYYDNEKDALVLSILEVDGVFNPFFSTSGTDSTIVGMTQIGMLGNNKDGKYTYGPDENVVVEDLQIIEYDAAGKEIDRTNKENDKIETARSKYYFVLKNNVVFSDGSPLTMKDVLFNLYVYLDNFYTGASTIYSTDIIGLQEYRTGEDSESEQDAFMLQFETKAGGRIDALLGAITAVKDADKNNKINSSELLEAALKDYLEKASNKDTYGNIVVDYKKAIELFKEELETDWSNSLDSYEDMTFKNSNGEVLKPFTTDVEVFLYNEGLITWNKKENAGAGEFLSSLTNDWTELKNYTKQQAMDAVFDSQIPDHIDEVLQYWATATELYTYLVNAEMEKYFLDNPRSDHPNIRGIRFANKDTTVTVNGKQYEAPTYYGEGEQNAHAHNAKVKTGNEVLSIEINKVDPKAIWNFSFAVAPMYYYSNEAQIALTDYESHFGVESSQTFMQTVVGNEEKSGVPVGAGPYMAATANDSTDNVERGTFHANSMVYFVRNENYIGGAPAIKKLRYSIVSASTVMTRLQSGEVDFAEPNAKQEIIEQLNDMKKKDGYDYKQIRTAGYGYIGINAAKVPDLEIRQAIMHAINTKECVNYYKTGASEIYRSMSRSNWAYPEECTPYYPYIGSPIPNDWNTVNVNPDYKDFVSRKHKKAGDTFTKEEQLEFLSGLVDTAGYKPGTGDAYVKGNNMLKYTFTIAGDETDHPAYSALLHASELLNEVGFEIDVKPDSQALKKLSTGSLTVWAAAWGSTIDPDMYQVYHKDSNASSVKNWGYPQILMNAGGKYERENAILDRLADLIEQGREVNGEDKRAPIYEKALTEVMKLAVELPTYQRDDLFAYNANKIDASTFTPDNMCSPYRGLMYDMHTVSLVVEK